MDTRAGENMGCGMVAGTAFNMKAVLASPKGAPVPYIVIRVINLARTYRSEKIKVASFLFFLFSSYLPD